MQSRTSCASWSSRFRKCASFVAMTGSPRSPESVPLRRLARLLPAVVHEVARDLAREARRGDDDPLAVRREQLAVDPRLHVEAFGVRQRRELHQIAISGEVAREEHEVVVRLGARGGSAALEARAGRHVGFHAEDGLDLRFLRLLLEFPRGVHVTVVGNGQRGLFQLEGAPDEIVDPVGPVEE